MFDYENNLKYVYGDDIAKLKKNEKVGDLYLPMYLIPGSYYANSNLPLTGWNPVWALECITAREHAVALDTSAPSATQPWKNEICLSPSIGMYGITDIWGRITSYRDNLEGEGFILDATKLQENKVVSGEIRFPSHLESNFPGLTTCAANDPDNTHGVMSTLRINGPLMKAHWRNGIWKRLQQMEHFYQNGNDLIPWMSYDDDTLVESGTEAGKGRYTESHGEFYTIQKTSIPNPSSKESTKVFQTDLCVRAARPGETSGVAYFDEFLDPHNGEWGPDYNYGVWFVIYAYNYYLDRATKQMVSQDGYVLVKRGGSVNFLYDMLSKMSTVKSLLGFTHEPQWIENTKAGRELLFEVGWPLTEYMYMRVISHFCIASIKRTTID